MAEDPLGDRDKWPADWPEDAKTGANFLRELHRRMPNLIQVGSFHDAVDWMGEGGPPLEESKKDEPA